MTKPEDDIVDLTAGVRKDHNCAQATAIGILTYFGHGSEAKTLAKSFVPFGGGVGEGSICGAVLGSLAGLSRILSEKNVVYRDIVKSGKDLKQLVEKQFGTYYCSELLKEFNGKETLTEEMKAKKSQKCTDVIEYSVKAVQSIIEGSF